MPKTPKKGARVACVVTGKEKYISEEYLQKKIARFGSIEGFRAHYVSNEAKRYLRRGMTVKEVREHLELGQDLPEVDLEILARLKLLKKEKKKNKKETKTFSDEERAAVQEQKKQKEEEYRKEIETFGAEGAWVREFTGVSNGGVCLRPDIYLGNGEYCDGCELFEHCMCRVWNGRTRRNGE